MKTIIKGGRIVNEGRVYEGIIIVDNEKISDIIEGTTCPEASFDQMIDASGCFVPRRKQRFYRKRRYYI